MIVGGLVAQSAVAAALLGLTGGFGSAHAQLTVDVRGSDSLGIEIALDWEAPLSPEVRERLESGIPVTVGFEVELWRERSGWFDRSVASLARIVQLERDPWDGAFVVRDGSGAMRRDSLATLCRDLGRQRLSVPIESAWAENQAHWHVHASAIVRPLTAEDLRELERWLGGGSSSASREVLGVPRTLLSLVRDVSGLGATVVESRSLSFRVSRLGEGVVVEFAPRAD